MSEIQHFWDDIYEDHQALENLHTSWAFLNKYAVYMTLFSLATSINKSTFDNTPSYLWFDVSKFPPEVVARFTTDLTTLFNPFSMAPIVDCDTSWVLLKLPRWLCMQACSW